jgi:hypothetical protein
MKAEYFYREDWTAQISMNLLGNVHFWRSRFSISWPRTSTDIRIYLPDSLPRQAD